MLVLSRNKNQKIRFPDLGVSVEILEVRGSGVRLGIDAPLEIRVLRDELEDRRPHLSPPDFHAIRIPQRLRHDLRNALHEVSLMLHVYQKRAEQNGEVGSPIDSHAMFEAIVKRLETLGNHSLLAGGDVVADGPSPNLPTKGRALVVDDNDNERELLAGFLRMCEYDVVTARDGLEAIELLQERQPPRVVLLDMHMPRCDGPSLLRHLRKQPAPARPQVFVVSGSSPEELDIESHDSYLHWFTKPLDPRRVVERLARLETAASVA